MTRHLVVDPACGQPHSQADSYGNQGVGPDGYIGAAVLDGNHDHRGGDESREGTAGVGLAEEDTQNEDAHQDAENETHEAVEPFIGRCHAALGQDYGHDNREDADEQGDVLTNPGLLLEAEFLLRQPGLNIKSQ